MAAADRSLKELLLSMTRERSLGRLLPHVVEGLSRQPHVALARIWLVEAGDDRALELVASAGTPRDPAADWGRLTGAFRRVPFGERKIGKVAQDGPLRIAQIDTDAPWIADVAWAKGERIVGFGGVPLKSGDEVLGVLAVFTREPFREDTLEWLELIGDHAAAAIANAHAFGEIERLKATLERENAYLREQVEPEGLGAIVGDSPVVAAMREAIATVAATDASVLVTGASGTGKELVARAVHALSARCDRPLVKVNCASVPHELFESEFFGHAKGAFTGAVRDRAGRFLLAHEGTLFLDEVGEIPLAMQSKLLRVLQEGEIERVGEEVTTKVDVRIVAATNRDLLRDVQEGRFREDLYYRLNVFPIHVPALRERASDVPALAAHVLRRLAPKLKRPVVELDAATEQALMAYAWPGNVRELQNVLERALILHKAGPLRVDLPHAAVPEPQSADERVVTDAEMKARERANVERALALAEGRIYGEGGAAERLGLNPSTLASRMKKLGIRKPSGA